MFQRNGRINFQVDNIWRWQVEVTHVARGVAGFKPAGKEARPAVIRTFAQDQKVVGFQHNPIGLALITVHLWAGVLTTPQSMELFAAWFTVGARGP